MPIVIKNMSKSFGGTAVLRGIDLTIGSGEVVALLGPSGLGKTTLRRSSPGWNGRMRAFCRFMAPIGCGWPRRTGTSASSFGITRRFHT